MEFNEVEKIVTEAIQKKFVVEVEYVRKNGTKSHTMVEPFDISAGKRSKTGELKFWGWCLSHDRLEQRTIPNIVSIKLTDRHFDPQARSKILSSFPNFRIPRDWQV